MLQTIDRSSAQYIPLLRSFRNILSARIYKHFVPLGLGRNTYSKNKKLRTCITENLSPLNSNQKTNGLNDSLLT